MSEPDDMTDPLEDTDTRSSSVAYDIAATIRAAAQRIPLGGTIRIKGSECISGYNLAEHCARIVEDIACERDVYRRLCDHPEKP